MQDLKCLIYVSGKTVVIFFFCGKRNEIEVSRAMKNVCGLGTALSASLKKE